MKINGYISLKEAADILGVHKATLRRWDKDGILSADRLKSSNYRFYKVDDIKLFLETRMLDGNDGPQKTNS